MVVTDYGSRWAEAFPTKDQKTTTVAKILIEEIICRYGAPKEILSDQGKNFLANLIKNICEYFRINKIQTTSYHPQTNGLTERFNGRLCKSSNETPFKLLFAREARLPADIDKRSPNKDFYKNIDSAWREAKESKRVMEC